MRVWIATMPEGAFYGQEAYLTRNSGILLGLAEWKNGVGRYLAAQTKTAVRFAPYEGK